MRKFKIKTKVNRNKIKEGSFGLNVVCRLQFGVEVLHNTLYERKKKKEQQKVCDHFWSSTNLVSCSYPHRQWYKDDLCALAFKVLHDKQRGPLVFLRIYSGTLKAQTAVHNLNRNNT